MEHVSRSNVLIFFRSSVVKINDSSKNALWGAPDLAHVNFCKLLRDNSVIVDSIRTGIVIFATY